MASAKDPLAPMVRANDKLLKALITLIALKEDHLLDDLRMVFRMAEHDGNPIADGDAATWAHVRQELALITALVDGEDPDEIDETEQSPLPAARFS